MGPKELVILIRNSNDLSVCHKIFFPTQKSLEEFKIPVYFHIMSTKDKMKSMSDLRFDVIERGLSIFKGLPPTTDIVSGKILFEERGVDIIFVEYQALTDTQDIKMCSKILLQRIALCGSDGNKAFNWEIQFKKRPTL